MSFQRFIVRKVNMMFSQSNKTFDMTVDTVDINQSDS